MVKHWNMKGGLKIILYKPEFKANKKANIESRTSYYRADCKKELKAIMKGLLKTDTTKWWN